MHSDLMMMVVDKDTITTQVQSRSQLGHNIPLFRLLNEIKVHSGISYLQILLACHRLPIPDRPITPHIPFRVAKQCISVFTLVHNQGLWRVGQGAGGLLWMCAGRLVGYIAGGDFWLLLILKTYQQMCYENTGIVIQRQIPRISTSSFLGLCTGFVQVC